MQKKKKISGWKPQMAGLRKSSSPKPELSHSTADRWPAGSHQHWRASSSLSLSLSVYLALSEPSISSETQSYSATFLNL